MPLQEHENKAKEAIDKAFKELSFVEWNYFLATVQEHLDEMDDQKTGD